MEEKISDCLTKEATFQINDGVAEIEESKVITAHGRSSRMTLSWKTLP
jgi:uncharacterized FAD-dependent dehydrogenase